MIPANPSRVGHVVRRLAAGWAKCFFVAGTGDSSRTSRFSPHRAQNARRGPRFASWKNGRSACVLPMPAAGRADPDVVLNRLGVRVGRSFVANQRRRRAHAARPFYLLASRHSQVVAIRRLFRRRLHPRGTAEGGPPRTRWVGARIEEKLLRRHPLRIRSRYGISYNCNRLPWL